MKKNVVNEMGQYNLEAYYIAIVIKTVWHWSGVDDR